MEWNTIAGWAIAGVVALGMVWAPVACTMSNNEKITSAIQSGTDPIVARCAYASAPDQAACAVAAARGSRHE